MIARQNNVRVGDAAVVVAVVVAAVVVEAAAAATEVVESTLTNTIGPKVSTCNGVREI